MDPLGCALGLPIALQELVNLLLLGRAHSNVFDGQRVIDGEGDRAKRPAHDEGLRENNECVVLTGVPTRGRVGFLTLFEAYKYVEVGARVGANCTPCENRMPLDNVTSR